MMTESAMFIRKLVKETFGLIYKISRLIKKKKLRRYVTVSMRWELIWMEQTSSLATAPRPTTSIRGLARLNSTFPKPSTACRKMPACRINCDYWVKCNWTWSNLNSSGAISPCDTCKRHCLDNTFCFDSNLKKGDRNLHGKGLADHKQGVFHQTCKFCQQPEKVQQ